MAHNLVIEEPVPGTEEWRRAPYLQIVGDSFWALAEAYPVEGALRANPTYFTSPVDLDRAELVNPSSDSVWSAGIFPTLSAALVLILSHPLIGRNGLMK